MQDGFGQTPLHTAAEEGYLHLLQIFVEEFGARTDIKNVRGRTALDVARMMKRQACVEYLESFEWLAGFNCFE